MRSWRSTRPSRRSLGASEEVAMEDYRTTVCAFCRTAMDVEAAVEHCCLPHGALVVSVRNLRATLLRLTARPDGTVVTELADPQPSAEMLEEAVLAAGGAMNISGLYPASEAIDRWVAETRPSFRR